MAGDRLLEMLMGLDKVQAPDGMGLYAQRFVPKDTQLNFEKRVLNPSQYPVLKQGDGFATHKMAWGEGDNGYQAYPTVVQDGNQLRELGGREAWDFANQTGEMRQFNTPFEASEYARGGYKNQWGAGEPSFIEQLKSLLAQGKK